VCACRKPDDIDVLNELQLLTAKPVVYLVNIGEDEYYQQKNKWLGKIKEWVVKRDAQAKVIPFSVVYEAKLTACADDGARKVLVEEKKVPSQMGKIITTGYHALDLVHFFTAGEDEVRGWTIKRGTLAPAAAGTIHTDFQKAFIAAEVMAFDDFKECGSEAAVKAAGKYRTKGKDYVFVDGDIAFFKHNAGGAKKK
jgi:obg-like ATPase 1